MNQPTKRKVFIVQNDKKFTNLVSDFLTDEGFEISCIYDGNEAVAKTLSHQPCAIILGLSLT
ncbi:MAG: hypothetical protein KTR16_05400, partial [Acidiferrobacterales bacterium]|nr:hypothetical protein [Acidiferrobacterales bacterium]